MNGEFSAMNVVNAEKEKQTFLRSKNVYGKLDASLVLRETSLATQEIREAGTFILFEARKPGHFRSGIHVAYCIVMQNAI